MNPEQTDDRRTPMTDEMLVTQEDRELVYKLSAMATSRAIHLTEDAMQLAARHRIAQTKADAARIAALEGRIAELEAKLVSEREDNLWEAYNSGHVKDGRWSHMFMSDGEWLAQQCGLDPRQADYPDYVIRAAIPKAARAALEQTP